MVIEYNKVEAMAREVVRNYYGFTFELTKSSKSESLYLYIHSDGFMKSMRISNHRNNYDYSFDKEIVSDKVNKKCLHRAIINLCEGLQRKKLNYGFRMVALQLSQQRVYC